jgi:hypothetical protein
MVITYLPNDKVSVKTKTETITFGDGVVIGDYSIPGAGEYEVASIQCEASYLEKATAYFVFTEDLNVTFLSDVDQSVTKEDSASKTDILVIDVRSDGGAAQIKNIVKAIEPSYVFLIGSGSHSELVESLGLTPFDGSTLKITRTGLPLEGTFLVSKA